MKKEGCIRCIGKGGAVKLRGVGVLRELRFPGESGANGRSESRYMKVRGLRGFYEWDGGDSASLLLLRNPYLYGFKLNKKRGRSRGVLQGTYSDGCNEVLLSASKFQNYDEASYIKCFRVVFPILYRLSPGASRLLWYMIELGTTWGQTWVYLDSSSAIGDLGLSEPSAFYKARKELIGRDIIRCHSGGAKGVYYLNPAYVYAGDRLELMKRFNSALLSYKSSREGGLVRVEEYILEAERYLWEVQGWGLSVYAGGVSDSVVRERWRKDIAREKAGALRLAAGMEQFLVEEGGVIEGFGGDLGVYEVGVGGDFGGINGGGWGNFG